MGGGDVGRSQSGEGDEGRRQQLGEGEAALHSLMSPDHVAGLAPHSVNTMARVTHKNKVQYNTQRKNSHLTLNCIQRNEQGKCNHMTLMVM